MTNNKLSIITHPHIRVLGVPHWTKPSPPTIVIAAVTHEQSREQQSDRTDTELYYPGEGFESFSDLPECMLGRVKRQKTIITWQVIIERQIDLVGVDTTVAIDSDNPQIVRTTTQVASGIQVIHWKSVLYGPIELVPPLDRWGFIPNCGGVSQDSWGYSQIVSQEGELPTAESITTNLGYDPWRIEAERVRDQFAWGEFDVEYGENSQGVLPLVRAVPLTQEILTDYVFPNDCSRSYTGESQINSDYLWVPNPPGQLVDDQPWQEEMEQWQEGIDWLTVLAQQSKKSREQLAEDGVVSFKTTASKDDKPTWQMTVTWKSRKGESDIVCTFANHAESRLVRVESLPEGGYREVRELWRYSWHPESGEYCQRLVKAGERRVLTSTAYPANWKVEAYEL